jgi:hypothetical protein
MFFIINIGELFFRADTLTDGFAMLGKILTDFHITELFRNISNLKMDEADLVIAAVGIILVAVVGMLHEKNIHIREEIAKWMLPARWALWYATIAIIVLFGAYGVGYTLVEMIYAGY